MRIVMIRIRPQSLLSQLLHLQAAYTGRKSRRSCWLTGRGGSSSSSGPCTGRTVALYRQGRGIGSLSSRYRTGKRNRVELENHDLPVSASTRTFPLSRQGRDWTGLEKGVGGRRKNHLPRIEQTVLCPPCSTHTLTLALAEHHHRQDPGDCLLHQRLLDSDRKSVV